MIWWSGFYYYLPWLDGRDGHSSHEFALCLEWVEEGGGNGGAEMGVGVEQVCEPLVLHVLSPTCCS